MRDAALLVALLAPAILPPVPPAVHAQSSSPGEPRLVQVRRIWGQAPHSAFTDLARFHDRWFCVFREGDAHASSGGVLRVITSADGEAWQSAAMIRLSTEAYCDLKPSVLPQGSYMDLRDPKLCITPDGRLMLHAGLSYNDAHDMQSLAWFSADGRNWNEPVLIGEHQYWLWRVSWHKGKAYGVGRIPTERIPRLYVSQDGRTFDVLVKGGDFFPHIPGASEATLRFLADDTALCLLRLNRMRGSKTVHAHLGTARPPYRQWQWKDLGAEIGGPNMIELPDGRFVAAVRLYGKEDRDRGAHTALCWLDPQAGTLTEFLTLPSGGDCSYAGLVFHDGLLWVSYYSSHEGKASIYLAKVAFVGVPSVPVSAAPMDANLLLRGGTIHDGSGAEPLVGDVAIREGRIVAVGKITPGKIGRIIDCRGLVVAPGLIDLHTHSDGTLAQPGVRPCLNYLLQGCTTMGTGNCGGAGDVAGFLNDVDAHGAGTNIVHLVGHGTVRGKVLGSARRAPTADELKRMKALVAQAMRDGAWGMSTGLIYAPGSYAQTDELIALARVVADHGGIYVSHIRDEGDHVVEAVGEAIRIGRESGAPVHISHFKSMQIPNWGRIRDAAALIEKARAEGIRITADQYPYTANSFSLADATLPAAQIQWCKPADLGKRMAGEPEFSALVRRVIAEQLGRTEKIVIAASKKFPGYVGKSLKEIAAEEKIDTVDLVLKIVAQEAPQIVSHSMSEDDVRWAMTLPWVATASDGAARALNPNEHHHPRNFGTFARKIGRYAVGEKVLSLPQAIRSATGLPADIFGLSERGYLRAGYHADIVVFDPALYRDQATFDKPQEYATGVRYVFLAGQAAVDDGKPSPKLFGRALRHRSAQQSGRGDLPPGHLPQP